MKFDPRDSGHWILALLALIILAALVLPVTHYDWFFSPIKF